MAGGDGVLLVGVPPLAAGAVADAGPGVAQVAVALAVPTVQRAVGHAQQLGALLQVQFAVLSSSHWSLFHDHLFFVTSLRGESSNVGTKKIFCIELNSIREACPLSGLLFFRR